MIRSEEQVLIVYSVKGTSATLIKEAEDAVTNYKLASSLVTSVIAKPFLFRVPSASSPGSSLGSELTRQLQYSIGAIVFLDDLRPNVSYELGFFHGQGKAVLLVTSKDIEEIWKSISDLAGCPLLCLKDSTLWDGIRAYLDTIYDAAARARPYQAPKLPCRSRNMLEEIAKGARISIDLHENDFGKALRVKTWGGVIFDVDYHLLPDAKFRIALRSEALNSLYSIYFRVRYVDKLGEGRRFMVGLTSNRSKTAFESNERTIPAQCASREWRLLNGTFSDLFKLGHVLGVQCIDHLDRIRVRAGEYWRPIDEEVPAYEIGYFEIIGVDH